MTDLLRLTAPIELEAAAPGDAKPRRLQILAYSGDPMIVAGYGPVVIALNGLELPASVPILADHDNRLGSVVASGAPTISNGSLSVRATLADSPAALNVASLLASGVALQASVGADPTQRVFVSAGECVRANGKDLVAGPRGLTVVERATLREISIVPVGADGSTSVALTAGVLPMPDTLPLPIDRDAILREERERRKTIDAITSGLHLDGAAAANLDALKARAISGEIGVDVLRAGALDLLRASRPPAPTIWTGRTSHVDSPAHLSAALMVRAGYSSDAEKQFGANVMQQSQSLHQASLVDLCRAALTIDGRPAPHSRDAMIRAAVSTGSMPIALGDSANKIMAVAYKQAPSAWRSFAAVKNANDFKTHTAIRPTFAGDLQEVPGGGDVKHASFGEETYTWSVGQYAKQLQIDRKQIVNDDASVFSEIVPAFARSAARTLNGLVARTILANASSFWATASLNYQEGAGTALSASSLAAAIKLLRQMKDSDGNLLDLQPAVLLCPADLEHTAKALVASATLERYGAATDNLPTANPFENVAQVVVEPRLSDSSFTGYSATGWYLFSAPSNASIIVAFLDGIETPTIETFGLDADIDHLSFGFRCYHDFGCALGDFRASIFSKGAA